MAAEISNSETDPTKLQVTNMAANTDDEDHEDETYAYATQIAESVSFPMVMRTAIELDILGIMARAGPGRQLSAAEIPGVRNPDAPEMLDRMLYLLATYSVVTCTAVDGGVGVERRYGLAAVGKYFVPDEDGASMGPGVLLNLHEAYLLGWSKLKEAVLEGGIAFDKFHGMNAFEYPETDPSFNELFNKAMCASSIHTIKNIVKRYKGFDNIHKLVDVGGGLGYSLQVITCNYPSIKGINFDLSHVIQQAPPIQGVKHVGGDMFESVPQGDAIFMKTAIELDILGIIARAGPGRQLSAAEIAAALPGVNNPDAPEMLDRMLYLLATHSVVTCTAVDGGAGAGVERRYGLAAVGKYFVPDEDGASLGPMVSLIQHQAFLLSWSKLKEAVLEGGIPFNKIHGVNAFEYQGRDPIFNDIFNKAMHDHSVYIIKNIVKSYKGFDNIHKLVEVGGSLGHSLQVIISNYPSIKGINFDLPHVIQHAPCIPGVEHVSGDMFESIPKGDVIFMKNILVDWSDDHCLQILKNCYEALQEKGKVIVVELNKPDEPSTTALARIAGQEDTLMMTINPGGKVRTRREFESLAKAAGFAQFNRICCVVNFWVMEFLK